jgi:prefoldin subunit 5
MSMDYQMLIQQGKEEYDKAMENLDKQLERLRPVNMMKEQAELTEHHNKIQQYTPLGIYVI